MADVSQLERVKEKYINPHKEIVKHLFPIIPNYMRTLDVQKVLKDQSNFYRRFDDVIYTDSTFSISIGIKCHCTEQLISIKIYKNNILLSVIFDQTRYRIHNGDEIIGFPLLLLDLMLPKINGLKFFEHSSTEVIFTNKHLYHRIDGPAIFNPFRTVPYQYYIDGTQYTKQKFRHHPKVLAFKNNLELFE